MQEEYKSLFSKIEFYTPRSTHCKNTLSQNASTVEKINSKVFFYSADLFPNCIALFSTLLANFLQSLFEKREKNIKNQTMEANGL